MGLDQYLTRKSYVKNWNFMKPADLHQITVKKGGKICKNIDSKKIAYIVEEIATWRKANAIHKWFVDNVQKGVDDCRNYRVTKDQLQALVDACNQVLNSVETVDGKIYAGTTYTADTVVDHMVDGQVVAQKGIAAKILPTQGGFFFGNTDYDEGYLDDLKDTVEMLTPYLADDDGQEYEYSSSW